MSASWSVAKRLASSQLASHGLFAMEEGSSASLPITCWAFSPACTERHMLNQCFPGSLAETQKPAQVFILPLNEVNSCDSYAGRPKGMCKRAGKGLNNPHGDVQWAPLSASALNVSSHCIHQVSFLLLAASQSARASEVAGRRAGWHDAVCPAETPFTGLPANCRACHNHSFISGFLNSACSGKAKFGQQE